MEVRANPRGQTKALNYSEAFAELADRCQCMVELCPDAILVQKNDTILMVNPAFVKLTGATNESELLGRSALGFVHPDSREVVVRCLDRLIKTGETHPSVEEKLVRLDGSIVEVEARAGRVPWEGESAVQVVLRDISERKKLDEQIKRSEAHFHQLANAMPQIVWSADAEGRIDYHNEKFYERTCLKEEDAFGEDLWCRILHPDDAALAESKWKTCVENGQPFQMEYRYRDCQTGAYRWHLGRSLPVKNEEGKVVRWFGTCTDIHEHKENELALARVQADLAEQKAGLEKQVERRTASLQSSVRSMEEFCYSIAHNLRAPLRAMQGFATAMLEDHAAALEPSGRDYATRIDRAAGHMDTLIHDLLSYGRLNHQELIMTSVSLGPVVEKAVSHFEHEIRSRHAVVRLGQLDFVVLAHDSVLEQIMTNFISNALKFVRPEMTAHIEIWAEERADMIRVWIRDNGIGIAPEHRKYIFQPFEKLHPTDDYPGTGIGLALVAKGAERLGGKVGLESEQGRGSRFWLEIPKAQPAS